METTTFWKDYLELKNLARVTRDFLSEHAEGLRRIEEQAQLQSEPSNVVRFRRARAPNLQLIEAQDAAPLLRHLLIPIRDGISVAKAAEEVHNSGKRLALINALAVADHIFESVETLRSFGECTLYIYDVDLMRESHRDVLKQYLAEPYFPEFPLIVAGI